MVTTSKVRRTHERQLPPLVIGASRPQNLKSQVQVISRTAQVLRSLEGEVHGLSLAAIAERVGLARSTVQRIVQALEAESLVIGATPRGRVRLGPALLRLAPAAELGIATVLRSHMRALSETVGETVHLSALARDHAVFLAMTRGTRRVCTLADVAVQLPLHSTANGKAMLALLPDKEIEQRIGRRYESSTARTLATFDALLHDIDSVRRTGIATCNEELAQGICALGVAFRDPNNGNILSLSVPMAAERFPVLQAPLAERLLQIKHTVRQLPPQP